MDIKNMIRDRIGTVKADDVLFALGLERKRHGAQRLFEAVGLVGAGLVVGAGLALLFAPQAGIETRRVIGQRAAGLKDRIAERAREAGEGRENGHTEPNP